MPFNFGFGFHPQVFHERLCSCIMFPVYYSLGWMQQSSPSLSSCSRAVEGCWGSFSAQWGCCGAHGVAHQRMLRMKMPIVCGLMRSLCPLLSGQVRMPADVIIVRLYFLKGRVPIYPSTQYLDTWPLHQKGLMELYKREYGVSPLFEAITTFTLLGRLSTSLWRICVEIFAHSSSRAFVRSGTDVGREVWLTVSIPKVFDWVEVRALCGSITPNSSNHVFMDLALCIGAQSWWNRKGPSPNCSRKVEGIAL